jgi:protein TonB
MKRYRIVRQRPYIPDEAAMENANFDELLAAYQKTRGRTRYLWRVTRNVVVFVGVLGLVFYGVVMDSFEIEYPDFQEREELTTDEEAPVTGQSEIMKDRDELSSGADQDQAVGSARDEQKRERQVPEGKASEEKLAEAPNRSAGFVEAVPVDGFPALYNYFNDNLMYPPEVIHEEIEGSVIVKFVIDVEGSPGKILIEKSLHHKIDSTAIELIRKMPKWHPATLDGHPVISTHRIPLFFQISKTTE